MSDTGTLLLIQIAVQGGSFVFAAIAAALFLRLVGVCGQAAIEAAFSEGDEDDAVRPPFPAMRAIALATGVVAFLAAGFSANVWMPKNDVSAPAVNETVREQIETERTRPMPVVAPSTQGAEDDAEAAARRRALLEDARDSFEALPE